jgi:hypothetical protein
MTRLTILLPLTGPIVAFLLRVDVAVSAGVSKLLGLDNRAAFPKQAGPLVPTLLLAAGRLSRRVDFVAILIFGSDKEARKWRRRGLIHHGLVLPDHAALADTSAR